MDNKTIAVPESCLPLLREHRTHYSGDFLEQYQAELHQTYEGFAPYLPAKKSPQILDIGAGMCGIDVLLSRHYEDKAMLSLLDKNGKSPQINAGFHKNANDFSHYCDFDAAAELLAANDVKKFFFYDLSETPLNRKKFDVVISLLSWGFHFPISTYAPIVNKGGVIIADVRKGTDGESALAKKGAVTVIHEAQKYRRVVVQC